MSDELSDELTKLYKYVKQLDRRTVKLRHAPFFRRPILSAMSFVLIFVLLIPAIASVTFLISR
ncbi:MAG: hypothetical protein KGN35_11310, partial [Betaproteobacteria bacterium]|nr:hypothetical protein [Betaproteobacteria bacterium]